MAVEGLVTDLWSVGNGSELTHRLRCWGCAIWTLPGKPYAGWCHVMVDLGSSDVGKRRGR